MAKTSHIFGLVLVLTLTTATTSLGQTCMSGSTFDRSNCRWKISEELDIEMNSAHLNARRFMLEEKALFRSMGSALFQTMPEQLEKSQRAFEAYREANCEFLSQATGGGTLSSRDTSGCRNEMTRDRIEILKPYGGH